MARVGLIGNNSVGYIEKLIDIWNNGDCVVLLDWRIPQTVIIEMLIQADANQCFI